NERLARENLDQGAKELIKKNLDLALPKLLLAVQLFKSVNAVHPELPKACQLLGEVYGQKGDHVAAIKAYNESIDREDSGMRRYARDLCYVQLRHYDKALTDFSQAVLLKDGKDRAEIHVDRANLLARAKRFAEANVGYDKATRLDPRSAQAFDYWGRSIA